MIVDDFDVARIAIFEYETYSKLIVNANTVLTLSITRQGLKTVSRRDIQLVEASCTMQNAKLFQCRILNVGRDFPAPASVPQSFRFGIGEAPDHIGIITRRVKNAKR